MSVKIFAKFKKNDGKLKIEKKEDLNSEEFSNYGFKILTYMFVLHQI